jgi:hypothetical protein
MLHCRRMAVRTRPSIDIGQDFIGYARVGVGKARPAVSQVATFRSLTIGVRISGCCNGTLSADDSNNPGLRKKFDH